MTDQITIVPPDESADPGQLLRVFRATGGDDPALCTCLADRGPDAEGPRYQVQVLAGRLSDDAGPGFITDVPEHRIEVLGYLSVPGYTS